MIVRRTLEFIVAATTMVMVGLGCQDYNMQIPCVDNDGDGHYENCSPVDCNDNDSTVNQGIDVDGDGYNSCVDCDDSNANINQGIDADNDGYNSCDDCVDYLAEVNPSKVEIICNGLNDDCDSSTPDKPDEDYDGDGFLVCDDCDDENASINPDALEECDGLDNNCDGNIDEIWIQYYGISESGYDDKFYSADKTNDNGYVLGGVSNSYGNGGYQFWLVKTDQDGNEELNRTYGEGNISTFVFAGAPVSVQQIDDGYLLAAAMDDGSGDYDVHILRLFSNGDLDWQFVFDTPEQNYVYSIQQKDDGNFAAAGSLDGFLWLLELSSDGNLMSSWDYNIPSAAIFVQQADDGYIIVTDNFEIVKIDQDGNAGNPSILTAGDFSHSAQQTYDEGVVVAGQGYEEGMLVANLTKADRDDNQEWSRDYVGESDDVAYSVIQKEDGRYALVGSSDFEEETDILFLGTDPNGLNEVRRNYDLSPHYPDIAHSVLEVDVNEYVISGSAFHVGLCCADGFLMQICESE